MKHESGQRTAFINYQFKGTIGLEIEHVPVRLIIYVTIASKAKSKKKEKKYRSQITASVWKETFLKSKILHDYLCLMFYNFF